MGAGGGNFSTFNGTMNAVQNTLAGSAETYPNYHFGGGLPGQLAINSSGESPVLNDGTSAHQGVVVQGVLKTANGGSQGVLSSWNTLANDGAGGSGGGAATITQGGTIELQGQNTYSGDTLVNVASTLFPNANNSTLSTLAILQVNNSSLASGGALVSGPIGTGTLHISQGGLQDGGLPVLLNNHVVLDGNAIFSSQGNGTLTFNSVGLSTPVTFDISNNPSLIVKNISTTISDAITGNSTLTKSGFGNLILDGNNTFTGNITINPATMTATAANGNTQTIFGLGWGGMQFNSPAAIGNAANTITVNGGSFAAPGPNYTNLQSTFFNRIVNTSTGTIALSASTADNFDWSAAGVNFTGASLGAVPGANVIYSGNMTANGGVYRLGGGGGTLNFASTIGGSSSVVTFPDNKTSSTTLSMNGTLVLSGANTYSGGTTISGTEMASYFNPGNGNNANPGNLVSNTQIGSNSAVSGGTLNSGALGTGLATINDAGAIQDPGTNVLVANSFQINPSGPFNAATTAQGYGFNTAGNGSLTLDGTGLSTPATINLATTPAGYSMVVNNFTTIRDAITGTLTYSAGNQFNTFSGTGTLVLAEQGTWSFTQAPANNIPTGLAGGNLLLASLNLRLGASSTVSGAFGSQTLVSGPMGVGPFGINGTGNVGTFLQDDGQIRSLANSLFINTVNPLKTDSTGNGAIVFDGTGLTNPAVIAINGNVTLGFLADNTVIVNDRILSGTSTLTSIVTIGNNNNTFPYGTVILNQPSNSTTAKPGSTYSGGFNANFGTVVLGASSMLNGATLVSGPAGTGTFTIAGNYPLVEDNGTTISVANTVATGGNIIFNSATGTGSLLFDGTARGFGSGNLVPNAVFNLTASGQYLIGNTVQINDQITSNQSITMLGTGKLIINQSPVSANITLTNGSSTFTVPANTGLAVNQVVTAPGLAAGTRITAISGTTITVSNAYTGTTGAQPVRFGETYNNTITSSGITQVNDPTSFGIGITSSANGGSIVQSTINIGGTLAAGTAYTSLQTSFLNHIAPYSTGSIAIEANSSESLNFSSSGNFNAPLVSLGAVGGSVAAPIVYSGTITPNGSTGGTGGTYRLGGGGGVLSVTSTLNSGNSLVVGGGGSGGVVQLANVFTGTTVVGAGTLEVDTAPANPSNFAGTIQLQPGSSISTGPSYGSLTSNLLPLLTTTSAGTIALGANSSENLNLATTPLVGVGAEQGTSVTYSGTLSPVGGTLNFGGGGGALTVSTNLTGSGSVAAFSGGSGGTLVPTGTNNYSGGTTLLPGATSQVFFNGLTPYTAFDNTAGILQLNSSSVVSAGAIQSGVIGTGALTLAGGKLQDNGTAITVANSVNLLGSTTLATTGGGSLTFDGTGLSSPSTFAVNNGAVLNVANTTTIADNITGGTGLTKAGFGTLVLSGAAKSYSGQTNVLGGTLRTSASNVLPSGTTLNVVLGAAKINYSSGTNNQGAATIDQSVSGSVDLNGTSQSVNGLIGTGYVTNSNAAGASLTIGGAGGSSQFYGIIKDGAGALSVTKTGAGLLTLGSANTYSGGTTVSGGTLRLASAGTGVLQMGGAGTTLTTTGGTTAILQGPVGTGTLTLSGGATLQDSGYATNLANAISLSGNVTFSSPSLSSAVGSPNAGSLLLDGTAVGNGVTLAGNTTLTVNNTTTIVDSIGQTGGARSLTMNGSGTLILAGANNTYSGTTVVSSGVLQLNTTSFASSLLVPNAGTLALGPGIGTGNPSTPIGTFLSSLNIGANSDGTVALTGNDSESVSFAGSNLSLGAVGNATFSGTLTPNGTTYRLGGGGGTLTYTGSLAGGNTLAVGGALAGGGSGGTVVLSNPLNIAATVNSGTLMLTTLGTGNITVNNGGSIAAAATYAATSATPITSSLLPRITTGSAGTLALTGNSIENLDFTSYPNLSLGAAGGSAVSYSGALTPANSTYRLGGGGGTLVMNSGLTGASNLVVNGSGSTGNVILNGSNNTYNGSTNIVKGTLSVGPNSSIMGGSGGTVTLGNGATLALLPYAAPLAATGWNYDEILAKGSESSAQSGVTASFGDAGLALYEKGVPGSQSVGNIGLPSSRSFASLANPNTVFQLNPYNTVNALKLGIGTNGQANSASYSPQGTLTLKTPGQYQSVSILNAAPFGNTFFEVQANFADGTSVLIPNTTNSSGGNLPNYYAADWTATTNFNVNTNNFQIAYLGAGQLTQTDNGGSFQGGAAGGLFNNMWAPNPKLYETDVIIPTSFNLNGNTVNLQQKNLTSLTIIDTGAFNGANNSTDYLHNINQLNILGISGSLVGSSSGSTFYSNNLALPAGASSTIDVQNTQGITFQGSLAMGDGSTLNVTNSLGSVNAVPNPFNLQLGNVTLPTTGTHTATFNVNTGAQDPVNLTLGTLDDGGAGPATINFTGGGFVTLNSFANLSNPHVNVASGATLILANTQGIGGTAQVNLALGSNIVIPGNSTVSSLAGTGNVLLSQGTTNGVLTVGSSDLLSTVFSGTFTGGGVVQNDSGAPSEVNPVLTLAGGNFANTQVNFGANNVNGVPSILAANTMSLGNTTTLSGGLLKLAATPGAASMSGFGGNYGVAYAFGAVVSNGWTINSNGNGAAAATDNGAGTTTAGFRTSAPSNNLSTWPYNLFPSKDVLRLTDGGNSEARSAFYNTPVPYAVGNSGFTTSFTLNIAGQMQADGVTFVLQNDPRGATAMGGFGLGKGYGFSTGQGAPLNPGPGPGQGAGFGASIVNSIAIHLNLFNGSPFGTGTGLGINGSVPPMIPVKWLNDGDPINVTVSYNPVGQTITETLTDTLVPANVFSTVYTGVNLSQIIGGPAAYVGFTGGTGGQFVDSQISNFTYSLAATTPGAYATTFNTSGSNGRIDLAASAATPNFSTTGGITGNGGTLPISAATAPGNLNYSMTFNGPSSISSPLTLNVFHAGPLNGGGTDGTGAGLGTANLAGPVTGAGSIINAGPGTVVLSGFNTFTGGTISQGSSTTAPLTVAAVNGSLGAGAVTLNGGTLQLRAPLPFASAAPNSTPIAAGGYNQDVILAANYTGAFSALTSFDGTGASHAPGNVLYETGTPNSPGGTGMPASPAPGVGPTVTSAFNPNVTFQFQPYSTATGAASPNDLQLNSATVTGTLALANPGHFSQLSIMHSTGNGAGNFAMQLNFADAPTLMVPSIASPDWFNGNANVFSSPGVGRTSGTATANFNSAPGNPRLYETDYNLPVAYQGATLTSITFDYLAGGEINIMGVSGDVLTNSNANMLNVTADSTIDVTGTATSGLAGATTIGSNTLHVTGGSTGPNAAYTLSVGTAGGVTLGGNPIFDVANNGSGVGTLSLGALNDQGSPKTIEFHGAGQTTLNTAATSLVQGTIITIDPGATLNSNAAGTASSGGSLGQFAEVSIGAGGTLGIGATQTISSLASSSATSKVVLSGGSTLGVGNTDNLSTVFAGAVSDTGGNGSLRIGVPGSTGSLTLSNANNTYHGTTTVAGGTLFLQAASNNIANSSTINVLSGGMLDVTGVAGGFTVAGGQTLQGASVLGGPGGGTANGAVTVGANATIAGTSTTPSTSLTVSVAGAGPALTLAGSSTSSFTLQGSLAGAIPLISTTSGSGTSLNITGANAVNVSSNSILPTEQSTFRLFSYTGPNLTATGSPGTTLNFTNGGSGSMALGSTPNSFTLSYGYQLSNQPGHIDLIVTPQGLTWAGVNPAGSATADSNWTTSAGDQNWASATAGNPASQFSNGQQVIFSDNYPTAGGPVAVSSPQNVVIQAAGVSTAGVTFGSTSVLYTFSNASGAVGITGPGGMNFVGSAAAPVTFDSANSFSGPVVISSGQVNLGDGTSTSADNSLGAATGAVGVGAGTGVTVALGATLNLNSPTGTSHSFGNSTAGGGATISLSISGIGTGNTGVLGALNSQSGNNTYAGVIRIAGVGATIASVSSAAGDQLTLSGGIDNSAATVAAVANFGGAGNILVSGPIKDAAGGLNPLSIALAGPGDLILSGSNSYHGSTTDPGLLILQSQFALGDSSGATVSSSGGLVLQSSGATMGLAKDGGAGIPLSLSGVGTGAAIPGTPGPLTSVGALTDVGINTYAGPISLPADATIATTAATDSLTLSGSVTIGTGGMNQTLTSIGPGSTIISGSIADASQSVLGNIAISNTGTGTTTLSGSSTYHGTTTVNTGALILTSNNSLGNTSSPVTVSSGAAIVVAGGTSSNPLSVGRTANGSLPITLSLTGAGVSGNSAATGGTGALTGSGTTNTYAGPITINTAATIATTAATTDVLTLSGALNSSNATTTLVGAGTTTITGAVNLNTGVLSVPATNGAGTYNVNNVVSDGGDGAFGSVSMAGTGTVNLNTGNTYGGGTAISQGKVVTGNTLSLGSGDVTLAGTGLLRLSTVVPNGFNGGAGWTVNNNGITSNPFPTVQVARLTDSAGNEARSIIYNQPQPINGNFTASFTYTPSAGTNPRADGTTFVLQEVGTSALGGAGGSLGYAGITGTTAAFEMNIFNGHTIGTNFVTNGTTGTYNLTQNGTNTAVGINSGDPINVVLTYNATAGTLTEKDTDATTNATYTTSYPVNFANLFGQNTAFVGFTGATGGDNSTQQISNYVFTPAVPLPSTYVNNVQLNPAATATIDVAATASIPSVTMGNLAVNSGDGAATLNVTATTAPSNLAYGLNLGAVNLNNNVTLNVANNGTGTGTLTLGALNDVGNSRIMTINGAGTVSLSTATTTMGSGSTIAVGSPTGNLFVTNTTGSPTGNAAVNVNTGGTLSGIFPTSGTGSIAGIVTVNGGTILGSNANALANKPLTVTGNLVLGPTVGSTAISSFALTTTPPTGIQTMIAAAGGLTVNGTDTVKLTGSPPTTFVLGQTYTYDLFSYAGTLSSNATGTTLTFAGGTGGSGGTGTMTLDTVANLPLSNVYSYKLKNDTANNEIEIVATPSPLTWTGATNGNWDTATSNWANTVPAAATYVNGAAVVFANTNPITNNTITQRTVTITPSTGVQPGIVLFQNSTINYTIANSGNNVGIGGAAVVTIQGTGGAGAQVTFTGANSFSGALTIGPGQLNLNDVETIAGTNYSLGMGAASSATVLAGGTLTLNGATGAVRTFGQGYNASGASGALTTGSLTGTIPLTLTGTGLAGAGALNSAAGNNTYLGPVTVSGLSATIASTGVPASGDLLTLAGGLFINGGTATFTGSGNTTLAAITDGGVGLPGSVQMSGTGTLTLSSANSFFGATTINSGTVVLSNPQALGNTPGVSVASGSTLALTGGTSGTPFTFARAADSSAIPLTISGAGATNGPFANLGALANSGVNTYTGPITVAASSTIGSTGATDSLTLNGAVNIQGGTVGSPNVLTAGGPTGSTTTFNSAINDGAGTGGSGVGKLVVSGGNVNLLAGTTSSNFNSYTGGTVINGSGTVVTASSGGLSSGPLTLNNNNGILRVVPTGAAGPSVTGFGGSGTGWTQNGTNAGTFVNGDDAQMTVNVNPGPTRSLFYNTPVEYQTAGANVGFTAKFTYQFNGGTNPPADGVCFVLQNDTRGATALGGGGGSFGYAGITPSMAIELNIFPPANGGQGTAFNINGGIGNNIAYTPGATTTNNLSTSPVTLASATGTPNGNPINITLFYNPTAQTLTENLVDSVTLASKSITYTGVNLGTILGGSNLATVGFTGAVGGSQATQDVTNFSFTNGNIPSAYPNTTVTGGIASTIDVSGVFAGDIPAAFGTLSIGSGGSTTLNLTDSTDAAGAAYGASFGATTLNSNATFNVANAALGANGGGTLTLGAISESGGSRSITKTGPGALLLTSSNAYSGGTIVTNGTLTAAADNGLGTGSLEVDTANGNVTAANVQGNQTITALSGTVTGAGSARVNVSAGKTLTVNQASNTTFAGNVALAGGATPGSGAVLSQTGGGTLTLSGVPALGNNSSLQVSAGSVKIAATTGSPSVGSGVTANVSGTGTLELAGSVSALGTTTAANRTNITNTSSATAGLLVSAGNQQVGGIDGSGTTQVNAGASLTANHIIQGALVIGGTAGSPATVTIDASDASGNPLVAASGAAILSSGSASDPISATALGPSGLSDLASNSSTSLAGSPSAGSSSPLGSGGTSAVPEPSTILLSLLAVAGALAAVRRRKVAR